MCDASKAQSELAHKAFYYKLLGIKKKRQRRRRKTIYPTESMCQNSKIKTKSIV